MNIYSVQFDDSTHSTVQFNPTIQFISTIQFICATPAKAAALSHSSAAQLECVALQLSLNGIELSRRIELNWIIIFNFEYGSTNYEQIYKMYKIYKKYKRYKI